MTSCVSILRIGGPTGIQSEAAIEIIHQQLLHHFSGNDNSDDDTNKNMLYFSNKYFEAQVKLKSIRSGDDSGDDVANNNNGNTDQEQEDGIILILPNDSSIESFTNIHNQALSNIETIGDTLRLCLTTTTATATSTSSTKLTQKQYEEQYSKRVLWCLDHGYEYIEIDLSEDGLTKGFELREKDGFPRVVEAIQGTVWSSAVMGIGKGKSRGRGNEGANSGSRQEQNNETEVNVNTIVLDKEDKNTNATIEKKENEKLNKDTNNNVEIDEDVDTDNNQNENIKNNNNNEEDEENDEGKEAILDDIEKVMKEASRIRQESKHGQMSDDERKQRAGDAAAMLMGLLDQIGFDDDEDDDDDSSSDDNE